MFIRWYIYQKAQEAGSSVLTVAEAQEAGIAGIDITSVTNKFLKENPGMVRTFVEVTHEANARYNAGKFRHEHNCKRCSYGSCWN